MAYATGSGWSIDVVRDPYSGGYRVDLTRGDATRTLGNRFGYARRETAENRAAREAEKLWDKEPEPTAPPAWSSTNLNANHPGSERHTSRLSGAE